MQLVSIGSEPTQAKLSRKMRPVPWPKKASLMAELSVGEGKGSYCDGLLHCFQSFYHSMQWSAGRIEG